MDNQYHKNKRVFMANDGSGDDIKIPSVFVDYDTGMTLKVSMRCSNREYREKQSRLVDRLFVFTDGYTIMGRQHNSRLSRLGSPRDQGQGAVVPLDLC